MADLFIFSSSSSEITVEDLKNSFFNLNKSSTGMQIILNDIKKYNLQNGTQTEIRIIDNLQVSTGNEVTGARTAKNGQTGNIIIEIEKNAFDGDSYSYNNGSNTNLMSLERYLAEELVHNHQRVYTDITNEETFSMTQEERDVVRTAWELEAQEVANKIMNQIYDYNEEPPADIPVDPINNPNLIIASGLEPVIKDATPADPNAFQALINNISTIYPDNIPTWLQDILNQIGAARDEASPLIVDLDGDGIELLPLSNGVYWDIDSDAFAEASGWVGPDDGLLVIDANEDGVITSHGELFGTVDEHGFVFLRGLDSDNNGVINGDDDGFDTLLVWQDMNSDGVSQENELQSLNDRNISSISLAYNETDYEVAGQTVSHESTLTFNGVTHVIADAWFEYNNANTQYIGEAVLDARTFFLPTARGYGNCVI
jgi:hypothetical protein